MERLGNLTAIGVGSYDIPGDLSGGWFGALSNLPRCQFHRTAVIIKQVIELGTLKPQHTISSKTLGRIDHFGTFSSGS